MRIIAANATAFSISQLHDVWTFSLLKQKTNGRYLWFRNSISTIVSQRIDSIVFMFLAFYKVTPEVDAVYVLHMILPPWTLKIGFSILDMLLVYLEVRWLISENEDLISDSEMNREVDETKVKTGSGSEQNLDSEISSQG